MLWRIENHFNLKFDIDALNRRRRRFCFRHTISHICQGERKQYACKCAWLCGICSAKNKIENEINPTTVLPT